MEKSHLIVWFNYYHVMRWSVCRIGNKATAAVFARSSVSAQSLQVRESSASGGDPCANGVADQRFAKLPDRTGRAAAITDRTIARSFVGDGQRRQELDRVVAVPGNLGEQLVLVEQRNHDQLAKTARCSRSPED